MNAIPSFPFELSIEFLNKLKSCGIRCKIYLVNKVKFFFFFGNLKKPFEMPKNSIKYQFYIIKIVAKTTSHHSIKPKRRY